MPRNETQLSKILKYIKKGYHGRDLNQIITKTDWNIVRNCEFHAELSFRNAIQTKRFVELIYL